MKILIHGTNWIGDAVLTTPAITRLRNLFPSAQISVISNPTTKDVYEGNPYINNVIVHNRKINRGIRFWKFVGNLRKENFDISVVLTNSFSSAFLSFCSGAKLRIGYNTELRGFLLTHKIPYSKTQLRNQHIVYNYIAIIDRLKDEALNCLNGGLSSCSEKELFPAQTEANTTDTLILRYSIDDEKWANDFLTSNNFTSDDILVGINPGATFGLSKMWLKERFAEVCVRIIRDYKAKIILFGGKNESELAEDIIKIASEIKETSQVLKTCEVCNSKDYIINSVGKTSIKTLSALLKRCKLLITNDTGPMHIASAVGTPVIALFTSTNPIWTAPFGNNHTIIYKKVECSPCYKRTCKYKHYNCVKAITVDDVMEVVNKYLY